MGSTPIGSTLIKFLDILFKNFIVSPIGVYFENIKTNTMRFIWYNLSTILFLLITAFVIDRHAGNWGWPLAMAFFCAVVPKLERNKLMEEEDEA